MGVIATLIDLLMWPPVFYLVIFPGFIFTFVLLIILIWAERKVAGRIQMRYGPLEISPRLAGALQLVADLLRYLTQEIIIPRRADRFPYFIAPIAAFVLGMLPIVAIPFSPHYYPIPMNDSILIAAALTTIPPLLTILAGWASNNKFSVIGGARESYLTAAYEAVILISIASIVLAYSTLDFTKAVMLQEQITWGILLNPIAALAMLVGIMMATSRFPFEIVEAEPEVVMGPYTEYSGIMYGLCMGISYVRMFVYNLIFTLLFLGGWHPAGLISTGSFVVDSILVPGAIVATKAIVLSLVMVFARSVYGRYRIDQALAAGWGFWFVIALLSLVVSIGVKAIIGWRA
uniref:NADH-quinone oxidoreductase subunit NuoH n=1 Tax=Fervidicoccus fontis TaxID=683846 RepID=A0A7J3ZLX6_9CREN